PPGAGRLCGGAVRREAALGQDVSSCPSGRAPAAVFRMIRRTGVRGQPLVLFGAVLAAWLAFRIAMWESPVVHPVTLSAQKARLVAAPAVPLQTVREQGASMAQAIPVPGKKVFARAPARFGG